FRWASHTPGSELTVRNTTLVEFFLAAEGDTVTVTVVESGFAALDAPEEVRQAAVKDNTGGWSQMMAELRDRAQAPGAGLAGPGRVTGGSGGGGGAVAGRGGGVRGGAAVGGGAAGDQIDRVFVALADPTRRQLLALLGGQEPASATALAGHLPMTRQAVVKHL